MSSEVRCPRCGARHPQDEAAPDGNLFCHRKGRLVVGGGAETSVSDTPALDPVARVMVATTSQIPGWDTVAVQGEVSATCASALAGGELTGLTGAITAGRDAALLRARKRAYELEANAIVGLRFDAELDDTGAEVVAYGTAVTVVPHEEAG